MNVPYMSSIRVEGEGEGGGEEGPRVEVWMRTLYLAVRRVRFEGRTRPTCS